MNKTTHPDQDIQETLQSLFIEKKKVKELQDKLKDIATEKQTLKEQLEKLSFQKGASHLSDVSEVLRRKIEALETNLKTSSSYSKRLEVQLNEEQLEAQKLQNQLKQQEESIHELHKEKTKLSQLLKTSHTETEILPKYEEAQAKISAYEEKIKQLTDSLKKAKLFIEGKLSQNTTSQENQELALSLKEIKENYQKLQEEKEKIESSLLLRNKISSFSLNLLQTSYKDNSDLETFLHTYQAINISLKNKRLLEEALEQQRQALQLLQNKEKELEDAQNALLNWESESKIQEKTFAISQQEIARVQSLEILCKEQKQLIASLETKIQQQEDSLHEWEKAKNRLKTLSEEKSASFQENIGLLQKHQDLILALQAKEDELARTNHYLQQTQAQLEQNIIQRNSWEAIDEHYKQQTQQLEKETTSLKKQLLQKNEENEALQQALQKTAKKYQELVLEQEESSFQKTEFSSLQQKLIAIQEELKKHQQENDSLKSYQKDIEHKLSHSSDSQINLQHHYENKIKNIENINKQIESQNEQLCVKQERLEGIIKDIEEQLEDKISQVKELKEKSVSLENKWSLLNSRYLELEETNGQLQRANQNTSKVLEQHKTLLTQSQADLASAQSHNSSLQNQKHLIESQLREVQYELEQVRKISEKYQHDVESLEEEKLNLEKQNKKYKETVLSLQAFSEESEKDLSFLRSELLKSRHDEETLRVELNNSREEYKALQEEYQDISNLKHHLVNLLNGYKTTLKKDERLSLEDLLPLHQLESIFSIYYEKSERLEEYQRELQEVVNQLIEEAEITQKRLLEKTEAFNAQSTYITHLEKQCEEYEKAQEKILDFAQEHAAYLGESLEINSNFAFAEQIQSLFLAYHSRCSYLEMQDKDLNSYIKQIERELKVKSDELVSRSHSLSELNDNVSQLRSDSNELQRLNHTLRNIVQEYSSDATPVEVVLEKVLTDYKHKSLSLEEQRNQLLVLLETTKNELSTTTTSLEKKEALLESLHQAFDQIEEKHLFFLKQNKQIQDLLLNFDAKSENSDHIHSENLSEILEKILSSHLEKYSLIEKEYQNTVSINKKTEEELAAAHHLIESEKNKNTSLNQILSKLETNYNKLSSVHNQLLQLVVPHATFLEKKASLTQSQSVAQQFELLMSTYQERCQKFETKNKELSSLLEVKETSFKEIEQLLIQKSQEVLNYEQELERCRSKISQLSGKENELQKTSEAKTLLEKKLTQTLEEKIALEDNLSSLQELLKKGHAELKNNQEQIQHLIRGIEQREERLQQYKSVSLSYEKLQEEHRDLLVRFQQHKEHAERITLDLEKNNALISQQKINIETLHHSFQKEQNDKQQALYENDKLKALIEEKDKRLSQILPLYETLKEEKKQQENLLQEQKSLFNKMQTDLSFAKQALLRGVSEARALEERYYEMVNEKIALLNKLQLLSSSLKTTENNLFELQEKYQSNKDELLKTESLLKTSQQAVSKKTEEYATLVQDLNFTKKERDLLQEQLSKSFKDIQDYKEASQTLLQQKDVFIQEKSLLEQQKIILDNQVKELENFLANYKKELDSTLEKKLALEVLFEKTKKENESFLELNETLHKEKRKLEDSLAELTKQLEVASHCIKDQTKEKEQLLSIIKTKENELEGFSKHVESKQDQIKAVVSETQRQQRIVEGLQADIADKDANLKVAQQHLAKKVKENTILQDFLEKKKIEAVELKSELTRLITKTEELESRLQMQKRNEEKLQAIAQNQTDEHRKELREWEDKYYRLQQQNQHLVQDNQDLLLIKKEHEQMQGLLSGLKVFMGSSGNPVPMSGTATTNAASSINSLPAPSLQNYDTTVSLPSSSSNVPDLFEGWSGSSKKKPNARIDSLF